MTRRGFFRLLGLAALTPAVVPNKLAEVKHWWVPVEQWIQEFDYGTVLGVGRSYRNLLTGETVRNAVRCRWHATRDLIPGDHDRWYRWATAQSNRLLDAWAAELPAWRRPVAQGRGHFVLEGREMST